ncbi:hypothetical protein [Acinetobacter baumannii]|nr:hypothetical protein [Acinetobacter baumannii]
MKLYLKDRLIAHGKLVAVDDVLGFQVTEVKRWSHLFEQLKAYL